MDGMDYRNRYRDRENKTDETSEVWVRTDMHHRQSQGLNQSFKRLTITDCVALGSRAVRGQLQGQQHGQLVASIPQQDQGNSQRESQVPMSYETDHNLST